MVCASLAPTEATVIHRRARTYVPLADCAEIARCIPILTRPFFNENLLLDVKMGDLELSETTFA